MEYVVGLVLALAVSCFARWSGLDRDNGFYPTLAIVIALYYVLFAAMGGEGYVLVIESAFVIPFVLMAVIGFKRNRWLVVVALAAHGVFDALLHDLVVMNAGVPEWWPGFCLTFDIGAAAFLACLELARRGGRGVSGREASRSCSIQAEL